MATNTEYLKTLITTAGGDASSLPDNLESTHYKALIEALANGTGGGGENWELIANSDEVIEGAEYLILTEDNNKESFRLKKAKLFLWTAKGGDYGYLNVGISPDNNWLCSAPGSGNKLDRFLFEKDVDGNWITYYTNNNYNPTTLLPTTDETLKIGKRKNVNDDFLTCVKAELKKTVVVKYALYGVRG